jgi:hypothetical protein
MSDFLTENVILQMKEPKRISDLQYKSIQFLTSC